MRVLAATYIAFLAAQAAQAFPAAVSRTPQLLSPFHSDPLPQILNHPAVREQLVRTEGRDVQSVNVTLANLVNGILNGSLPGVPFPGLNLPLGLGPLQLEVPPVASIGRKAIPDADHQFIAPSSTDQRGGCPGLNSK